MKILLLLLAAAALAAAQASPHQATVAWTDPNNPVGTSYNVYRSSGACVLGVQVGGGGLPLASSIAAKIYTDTTVVTGAYCYAVTALYGGAESPQSAQVQANIPPIAPTTVTVFAK